MTESLSTTVVSILGDRYPIRSDADPAYLHELARYVETKIRSVSSQTKLPTPLKAEVLASILIADEYFNEKIKNKNIEEKLLELSEMLETALPGANQETALT
jgi:cell division protein ZapA